MIDRLEEERSRLYYFEGNAENNNRPAICSSDEFI